MELEVFTLFMDSLTGSGSYLSPEVGQTIRSFDFPDNQQYYIQGIVVDVQKEKDGEQIIQFEITIDCSSTEPWTRMEEIFTLQLKPGFEATWGIDRVILVDPRDPWDNHNPFYDPHFSSEPTVIPSKEFVNHFKDLDEFLDQVILVSDFVEDTGDHSLTFFVADKRSEWNHSCQAELTASCLQHLLWDQQASKVFLTNFYRTHQGTNKQEE